MSFSAYTLNIDQGTIFQARVGMVRGVVPPMSTQITVALMSPMSRQCIGLEVPHLNLKEMWYR